MAHPSPRGMSPAGVALAVCAALSALAWPSASAQSMAAQRIVIDRDTGRARMPEHDELSATRPAQARMGARAAAAEPGTVKSALRSHPAMQLLTAQPLNAQLGARGSRVDASRLSFTVVRRQADGRISTQCVDGEDNASKALHGALGEPHDR